MNLQADLQAAILDVNVNGDSAEARLRFSGDEEFFVGHFPSGPVLPAVVQVSAAVMLAGRVAGRELRLSEVTRAKFTNPTAPGRELTFTVSIEEVEDRIRVKAEVNEGDKEVAEFTLRVQ